MTTPPSGRPWSSSASLPAPAASPDGWCTSHKLPGGYWLPGAASNTGGEWIGVQFPRQDPAALDRQAASLLPSHLVAYPWRAPGSGSRSPVPGRGVLRSRAGLLPGAVRRQPAGSGLHRAPGVRGARRRGQGRRRLRVRDRGPRRGATSGCSCAPTPPAAAFTGRSVRSPPSAARSWPRRQC